jgi:hypothetical protein
MSRKPRPSVTEVLRFSQQLSGLCARYHVEAWFVPHSSLRRIELYDLAHLPKSYVRSGSFAVAFVPDRPQHRPVRSADWYVVLGDIGTLMDTLETEFLGRLLQFTFESSDPS